MTVPSVRRLSFRGISLSCGVVCLLFQYVSHTFCDNFVADLTQVHVIFRHGDRGPLRDFNGSGYNPKDWPAGLGELTDHGIEDQYLFGQFLRERYAGFLTPGRTNQEVLLVYIRSTDHDRTLQSAAALAAGMFPQPQNSSWNVNDPHNELGHLWRPVSVHTTPADQEFVLKQTAQCMKLERLNKELAKIHELVIQTEQTQVSSEQDGGPSISQSEAVEIVQQELDAFLSKYASNAGSIRGSAPSFWDRVPVVDDMYRSLTLHGLPLPAWMQNESVMRNLTFLAQLQFYYWVGGHHDVPRTRLVGGALLNLILQHMHNASQDPAKFFLYSGHDSTVAGLLAALQLYNRDSNYPARYIPAYNTALIMELFKNDTVRMTYTDMHAQMVPEEYSSSDHFPSKPGNSHVYTHPKCRGEQLCPLGTLTTFSKDYLVADWSSECDDRHFIIRALVDHAPATGAWVVVAILGILILLLITFRWWKDRKQRNYNRQVTHDPHASSEPVVSYRTLENLNV